MGEAVSAAVSVNCWPSFNAGLSEKRHWTSSSSVNSQHLEASASQMKSATANNMQLKRKDYEVEHQNFKR